MRGLECDVGTDRAASEVGVLEEFSLTTLLARRGRAEEDKLMEADIGFLELDGVRVIFFISRLRDSTGKEVLGENYTALSLGVGAEC
jgi:hypothetical protein